MIRVAAGVAVVLIALACGSGGADGPPVNQGPSNVKCSVRADYPHQSSGTPTSIDGKVRVKCSGGTIESLTIEAKLQRLDGKSGWTSRPPAIPVGSRPPRQGQRTFVRRTSRAR